MKRKLGIIIATVVAIAGAYGVASVAAADVATSQDLNCSDFASQAEAQAELDKDKNDPHGLDGDGDGMACEDTDSDDGGSGDGGSDDGGGDPGNTPKDLDCKDFASQAEAQQELANDPSDPHNLDADDDGQACEAFDYGGDDDSDDDDGDGGTAPTPDPVETQHAVTG